MQKRVIAVRFRCRAMHPNAETKNPDETIVRIFCLDISGSLRHAAADKIRFSDG